MKWNKNTSTVPLDSPPLVGNDVVDLNEPATRGKASQPRFLQRVCVAQEQRYIETALQPDLALWLIWSAKETAFKIVKRQRPKIRFVKKRFVVEVLDLSLKAKRLQGRVLYEGAAIPVRWQCEGAFVHCAGYWPGVVKGFSTVDVAVAHLDEPALEAVWLEEQELQSVRGLPSRRVRQLAKRMLTNRGMIDARVMRQRIDGQWKAPRIWRAGRPVKNSALSLSHHGQYVAVALWLPA